MSSLAVITARGGSKRIPRKNIKDFLGKPIIAYSIEAALESGVFDEVMVSTDDAEIAEIAKKYGAKVPFMRSEATSNDYATTADVLREVLDNYESRDRNFDTVCCIYPTAPFISASKLNSAMAELDRSDSDAIVPVVRFSFPPQRGFIVREGNLRFQYPEYALTRSQDLEPIYHDSGQFYIFRSEAFKREGKVIMNKTLPFIVSEMEVQDIDNETDWAIAEEKYKRIIKGE
ncbi:MAG: pseudaminic acid cytidylyltransferase [Lachnospiraceae bacterium]|nr:pseudaminic acid cytidylyltransferase [Lachnospiraceae bacterium]